MEQKMHKPEVRNEEDLLEILEEQLKDAPVVQCHHALVHNPFEWDKAEAE